MNRARDRPSRRIRRLLALAGWLALTASADERVHFGMFGDLHLARPSETPDSVVLLVSAGDGWTTRMQALADGLAAAGALAVGIDQPAYRARLDALGEACTYPAGHFEEMAHWIERHEGLTGYRVPFVAADGDGAALAYALVAQAPAGTFAGLVTLGWNWSEAFARPFCAGDAGTPSRADGTDGFRVAPVAALPVGWIAHPLATGSHDTGPAATLATIWRPLAALLSAPAPDPGAEAASACAELKLRGNALQADLPANIADLPLTEIAPTANDDGRIVLMLTGDGGWAGLDKGVAAVLAAEGMRVIGFSTLKFFWEKRTPQATVDAVRRVLADYAGRYPRARFAIVGYSFGASLVPYLVNRLPADLQRRIDGATMISPDDEAVFEIRIGDWFGGARHDDAVPVMPEIARGALTITCIHGSEETDSFCAGAREPKLVVRNLPGGHHYDGDYAALGKLIAEALAVNAPDRAR